MLCPYPFCLETWSGFGSLKFGFLFLEILFLDLLKVLNIFICPPRVLHHFDTLSINSTVIFKFP